MGDCESEEFETRNEDCLVCDPGYEANEDDTECVDIDECALGHCPENSDCTNTEGSYSCQCHDGMFGDDMNFCIVPRGCHGGDGDCTCQTLINPNVTTIRTSWSSEEDTRCKLEYFMDLPLEAVETKVNSWKLFLNFENPAQIVDIWRARTDMDSVGLEHELSTMYFNVEQIMSMTFHAAFAQSCESLEDETPQITLCTEEAIVTTTSTTTTTTVAQTEPATQPTTAATEPATEPPLVLSEEQCDSYELTVTGGWQNAEDLTVTQVTLSINAGEGAHEWRIVTPFGEGTTINTWNFEVSMEDSWTLSAKEYNQVLYGMSSNSMHVVGDFGDSNEISFCYKNELKNE